MAWVFPSRRIKVPIPKPPEPPKQLLSHEQILADLEQERQRIMQDMAESNLKYAIWTSYSNQGLHAFCIMIGLMGLEILLKLIGWETPPLKTGITSAQLAAVSFQIYYLVMGIRKGR